MSRYITLILTIFFSSAIIASEATPLLSMAPNDVSYILIDGKLKVVVPVGDSSKMNMVSSSGSSQHIWGLDDMLSTIQAAKNQVASNICENSSKPDNVTITIFLVSFTWDTKILCKDYKKK